MGTPDRTTDGSAPSVETPDSTAVRTRYQAPIRNLRPASPEVSAPSTAMHRAVPVNAVQITPAEDASRPASHVVQAPATSLNPVVAPAVLPAFLRTYSREELKKRQSQLRKNLLVRIAILSVLGLTEGLIIASTRNRWRFASGWLRPCTSSFRPGRFGARRTMSPTPLCTVFGRFAP